MAENITTNNNGGANSSNALSRKKSNNGGDLTASPKYNKSNARGLNRDSQQQKPNRATNTREQRSGEPNNGRSRQRGQPPPSRVNVDPPWDLHSLDEENLDDGSGELFDFGDQSVSKRGDSAKKTNMSHLLNFHYLDKQRVNVRGNRRGFNSHYHSHGRWTSGGHAAYRQSFSKEQFLQANCQFVVRTGSIDYSLHYADPDLTVDWSHIEQVRLHSMQTLKCPICLSEPQAGKITRCGHVYCWSCLLHYLALSDKSWRKCPVCAESIYKQDIRSVQGIVSRSLKPGDWIRFRLMCRERGSVLFYPKDTVQSEDLLQEINRQQYAHLLSADDQTIVGDIIDKERFELLKQLEEDGEQPEACFIKQALEEINEREESVRQRMETRKVTDEVKLIPKPAEIQEIEIVPSKPALVYNNAFDDVIELNSIEEENQNEQRPAETNIASAPAASQGQSNRIYFYQADEIHHAYLAGLNTRILLHEYGSYQQCPSELHVRVEAIESHFMTEELRSQFRSLSHLPLTCEFQVIEIRLHPPIISPGTAQLFSEEIHRRRQFRTRKERLEKRRQEQAEFAESQKLFSSYPPEMMYIPQEKFPVNGTNSMEEFPAIISSAASSSPPSASVQLSDENLSPPASVSFAQMLKQQAPPPPSATTNKPSWPVDLSLKKKNHRNDEEPLNEDEEYYAPTPNFRSSFSLEEVFDRLKLVNGEEHPVSSVNQGTGNGTAKKKNKKNKQVLFATGLGGQAKL